MKERQSREAIILFLMKATGLSRQDTIVNVKELEQFGLISFNSKGEFRMREV
ncbi:TPA: hypothetical protein ACIN0K_000774 [Streptococcus agalactiae]